MQKAYEYEMSRGKDLQSKFSDCNVRLNARVTDIGRLEKDVDYVQSENDKLVDKSNNQQCAVNEMARHMNMITEQNFKLSAELQRFL